MQAEQIQNLEAATCAEGSRQIITRKSVQKRREVMVGQRKAKIHERNWINLIDKIRKRRRNIEIPQNSAVNTLRRMVDFI